MSELKVGIQLASLRQPFKKALHTAAQLGADAIEIDARQMLKPRDLTKTAARQLRNMLDDLNLRVAAIGFRTRRSYANSDALDARVEATKDALRMAYQLGAPVVINQVGRVPDESEGGEWEMLCQVLTDLGQFGQRAGATLAAKTGAEDGPAMKRLLEALPDGALAVDFDPGNLIINGFSASEAIQSLAPHVAHVTATDGVRDLAQGRGVETPIGRGSVDFPQLIATLEQHRYSGYYTIERERTAAPVQEVGDAVQYLRALMND